MAYVKKIFDDNFLYYASYVIKDRAIPDVDDGLKPVQRRILHSLFDMEDGKFHKVANVVGHCMKYHPHGDASIYSALVVLANKELFIDRQGNFGNLYTGDEASAARYIECRATPLAKDVFYNPKTTAYEDSYDGRNREPTVFPAKLPVVLITGAEGIAVGMSTKILPHNPVEVIEAEIACLRGKPFRVYPDFPTAGIADVSDYDDGMGKVRVRARLDLSDPKRIVIRELPFGSTTESLIASVEAAAKSGRIKIASISDFTTDTVEIEIRLQRGVYAEDVVDALYAFTECEQSISCNLLVIRDELPSLMRAREIIERHSKKLLGILKAELQIEERELKDDIHARTLERIFIEERVYKRIEDKRTQEGVDKAVLDGLAPFQKEIRREVTLEDVERLLKIPIRRISLFDIEKAKAEMARLEARLKEVRKHLANLVDYAVGWLEAVAKRLGPGWKRKTALQGFTKVDVREAARRDIALRYDRQTGYLGTAVPTGEVLFQASPYDKILVIRHSGMWSVVPLPERLFVDRDMLHCSAAEKETLAGVAFSIVYKDEAQGHPHMKRFKIEGWIMNKDYPLLPEGAQVLWLTAAPKARFKISYKPKPRFKIHTEDFRVEDYDVRGIKANGLRLAPREAISAESPDPAPSLDFLPRPADAAASRSERSTGKSAAKPASSEPEAAKEKTERKEPKAAAKRAGRGARAAEPEKGGAVVKKKTAKAEAIPKKPSVAKKPSAEKRDVTGIEKKNPAKAATEGSGLLGKAEAMKAAKKNPSKGKKKG